LVQVEGNTIDIGKDVKTPIYRNPIIENTNIIGETKPKINSVRFVDSSDLSDIPGERTDLHEVEGSLSPRPTPIFVTKTS
jgi:hypothetical protein